MRLILRAMFPCLAGGLLLSLAAGIAQAGFSIQFLNTTPSGANTSYNYNVVFETVAGQEGIIADAGTLTPGVAGTQDFVTIYDFAGFVSVTPGAFFTTIMQLEGVNGPQTAPLDNPAINNITFRYTGANVSVNTTFSGISIVSTFSTPDLDNYTSQRTNNLGADAGTKIGEVGTTTVAVGPQQAVGTVPEPATLAIWGIGALGCAVAGYRRQRVK